jgi:hypothetical protein
MKEKLNFPKKYRVKLGTNKISTLVCYDMELITIVKNVEV